MYGLMAYCINMKKSASTKAPKSVEYGERFRSVLALKRSVTAPINMTKIISVMIIVRNIVPFSRAIPAMG